jgi:molybdenum-dependent DNA-binding transcriptional regulator ModE
MMMNEYRWVITMEMRHLKTFKVITETGGFTRAAEVLGYAQSSVTAHIKALEAELGTPLLDRIGKRVILTQAGERLLPYANEVLRIYDRIHDLSESCESALYFVKDERNFFKLKWTIYFPPPFQFANIFSD